MSDFNRCCLDGYLTAACKHCPHWVNGTFSNPHGFGYLLGHGCACPFPIAECNHFTNFERISQLVRHKNESSYDFVMRKLDKRIKGTPMYIEEANWLLEGTGIYIDSNVYVEGFCVCINENQPIYGYNTPRAALNAALEYMKKGDC